MKSDRTKGIGGSDWADILELADYGCRRKVYYTKIGEKPIEKYNPNIERGKALEPTAKIQFFKQQNEYIPTKKIRVKKYKSGILIAHLDGYCEDTQGNIYVLEIKCPSPQTFTKSKTEIPQGYIYQVQQYMYVSDIPRGIIVFYDASSNKIIYHTLERDEKIITHIQTESVSFWEKIKKREIPERRFARDSDVCKFCQFAHICWGEEKQIYKAEIRDITNDSELLDVSKMYLKYNSMIKEYEKTLDIVKNKIKKYLQENQIQGIKWDGGGEIRMREEERENVNITKLRQEHPELIQKYLERKIIYKLITKEETNE